MNAQQITLSVLCEETGIARSTAKKRLKEAGPWTLKEVLDAWAAYAAGQAEKLDLATERALLAHEQRRKLQRENDLAEGLARPTIPLDEVQALLHRFFEGWHNLTAFAANRTAGQALSGYLSQDAAHFGELLAAELRQGLVNAVAAFATTWPPEIREPVIDAIAKGAPHWEALPAIDARIRAVNELTRELGSAIEQELGLK